MFNYRHYRAIGNFYCPHCGLKSKTGDFIGTKLDFDKREMLVKEKDGEFKYPLVSDTIFNAFNIMAIITLFRTIGYSPEVIAEHIKHIKLPENRVACEDLGKIKCIHSPQRDRMFLLHLPYLSISQKSHRRKSLSFCLMSITEMTLILRQSLGYMKPI